MIYRQMPATWDPQFRSRFYTNWGRENAVIAASTRSIEYPNYRQLLSIKAAAGGDEEYFIDGRRIAVGDDTFLILNANRTYSSRVQALNPIQSFSIFFRPGLLDDVLRVLTEPSASRLESHADTRTVAFEFAEHLHYHDRSVSPVLRHIYNNVTNGVTDDLWIEEQLQFLLQRMLRLHYRERVRESEMSAARPATRKEIFRRLGLGVTFMHSNYRESIDLDAIASASFLSRFHFLRSFKEVYGVTPSVYLNRYRTGVAARLLATTSLTHTAIAHSVGFGSRTTLYRQLRVASGNLRSRPNGSYGGRAVELLESHRSLWPPTVIAEPERGSRARSRRTRTPRDR
jgi:AraC family transcriptional regulator